MIVLAIVCGILANELFAWGPRLSDLLLKIAVSRMPLKLQERLREEWQSHLNALPGGLSKLSAAAGFLLATFLGFRRYRQDETPIEIEERIAFEITLALNQERERVRGVLETLKAKFDAEKEGAEQALKLLRADENRTQLVKRRIFAQDRADLPRLGLTMATRPPGTKAGRAKYSLLSGPPTLPHRSGGGSFSPSARKEWP